MKYLAVALLVLACLSPAEARRGRFGRGGFGGGFGGFGGYSSFTMPVSYSSFSSYGYDEFGDPLPPPLPPGYRTMSPEEAARVADAGHAQRLATAGSPSIPTMPAFHAPQPAPLREYVPPPPAPPAEPRTIEMDGSEPSVTVIRKANGITEIVPR